MSVLILTVGLPASGKTTFAKGVRAHSPNVCLVSKDELRAMLHGSVFSKANERQTVAAQDAIVLQAMCDDRDCIVHDTNLNPTMVKRFISRAGDINSSGVYPPILVRIKSFLDVPKEVCVERNVGRINAVPDHVILNMYNKWFNKTGEWVGLKDKEISALIY
jgi:predicted kinase